MAKLKNMGYSKAEIKERNSPSEKLCGSSYSGDKYPYGLRIDLNNQALEKLGLDSLPKPGTKMTVTAEVTVVGARLSQRQDGDDDRSLDLQITKMALDEADSAVSMLEKGMEDADEE